MNLGFCLYKYFPYGGLQRDFMQIALQCQQRGHSIRVYCLSWAGDKPSGFDIVIVPAKALSNHRRNTKFSAWVENDLRDNSVDCVIGLNKMPGLDVYYAADSCYEEKARHQRSWIYRLTPRYKHFSGYEAAVFDKDSSTEILMISELQKPYFQKYYATPEARQHFLPPGISRDRIAPPNAEEVRVKKRLALGILEDENLVLMVGSGFIKKGLSRALLAISSLPSDICAKTKFFVVGEDKIGPFQRQANRLDISDRLTFLSGREDVPELMLAGDVLIHPALDENAGIVLLEAIVAGLPVLATDVCGYGHYVLESGVGELISSPFCQKELNEKLLAMLFENQRDQRRLKAKNFAKRADIYSLSLNAARVIESVSMPKKALPASKAMLAFCLFRYFPFGGLQRDFIRIAEKCAEQAYKIRVYALSWEDEVPDYIELVIVPVRALTNHKKIERYVAWVENHITENPVAAVVGFNKMPNLDIYYAADGCYEEKARSQRGFLYRLTPRYKLLSRFERAVFGAGLKTRILMISELQKPFFEKHYQTEPNRFHLLPPGISKDRMAPSDRTPIRHLLREEFGIQNQDYLLLMVGSGFITKGLDRILLGISSLPKEVAAKTQLIVIGQDKPHTFLRMAKRLNIENNVTILSGRSDIPRFLLAADLLVHPAYAENTGTVLLEAIVAGLPVLATDVCGYANYIEEAQAGKLVKSEYQQSAFDALLLEMLLSDEKLAWQQNGIKFGKYADIYNMSSKAADLIAEMTK